MSSISTKDAFDKELKGVEDLYKEITGEAMTKYYRPPQGKYSIENLQMAKDLGYHTFFWSLAYVDWIEDEQPSKEEAIVKLLTVSIRAPSCCFTAPPKPMRRFWMSC